VNVNLTFVVGSAASKQISVADGGFERRRSPKLEGFGRLNVVVAVEKNGGLAGSFERFGVDERVEICGNDLNRIKSGGTQLVGYPRGGALDVRLVLALGADAGNAHELQQLGEVLVTATFDKFSKVHTGS
jgi:hypothetical protein